MRCKTTLEKFSNSLDTAKEKKNQVTSKYSKGNYAKLSTETKKLKKLFVGQWSLKGEKIEGQKKNI